MNIVDRVRNILLSPKKEWQVIAKEEADGVKLLIGYIIPLVLFGAVAAFLGFGLLNDKAQVYPAASISNGLYYALNRIIVTTATLFVVCIVLNELAPVFDSQKNFSKTFQLVAYSATPALVASIFSIVPAVEPFARAAGTLYAFYICYVGLQPIKQTPASKKLAYIVFGFISIFIAYGLLGALYQAITYPLFSHLN